MSTVTVADVRRLLSGSDAAVMVIWPDNTVGIAADRTIAADGGGRVIARRRAFTDDDLDLAEIADFLCAVAEGRAPISKVDWFHPLGR